MKTSMTNMRKRFEGWRVASRQRRELREHCADICKDIGVSQATLDFEAKRLFWKEDTETPDSIRQRRKSLAV